MTDFTVSTQFTGKDGVSAVLAGMGANADRFSSRLSKGLDGASAGLSKARANIMSMAAPLGIASGASLVAANNIIGAGADFEEAMSAVGAVGLQTRDQIADLEAHARHLGATTKFTAKDAANAMEIMSQAGFNNQEILAGVGPILSAAAASGMEIAETAGHVSNALKGMGLATNQAGRVADVLAVASAATNSSIGSLGESLSGVSSTARQFNIPLEDTVAAVALLQDVGLDASVAGSALNTMLTQMAKPTDDVAASMKKWGVTFKDANGNMLPFRDVLANISKAADASGGNMDQVAFIADLVGLRGQKAAANLKDLFNAGKTDELTEQLYKAAGAAKKMADIRMDNLKGDWELLDSAVDGVKLKIFNLNAGPMRGIVQATSEWIEKNEALIAGKIGDFIGGLIENLPEIVKWTERIGIAAGIFFGMEMGIKGVSTAIDTGKGIVWAYRGVAAGAAAAQSIFSDKTTAAAKAMGALNTVAAVNPMWWLAAAVAGVALLVLYYDEATDAAERFIDSAWSLFSDEHAAETKKKRAAIDKGLLLEHEEMPEDAEERKGSLAGITHSILERGKEIEKEIQREMEKAGVGKELEPRSVDTPAGAAVAGGNLSPAEMAIQASMRGGSPFDFGGGVTTKEETLQKQESKTEITIKDETGRAQVTKKPTGSGTEVKLKQSGGV